MSAVSRNYAPAGRALISVSVVDSEAQEAPMLESSMRDQLCTWFGATVAKWRHLRTYRLQDALPLQQKAIDRPLRFRSGVYRCGDYCGLASLDQALASGRAAAEAALADMA
jgi:predicted NAD/FAD-dependent oxidoreductase